MTANQYQVLFGLYVFPDYNINQQWQINALNDLVSGLFVSLKTNSKSESSYELTDKAKCLIEHVLNLPMPTQTWSMP
jgi:predicted transcriptional regulator